MDDSVKQGLLQKIKIIEGLLEEVKVVLEGSIVTEAEESSPVPTTITRINDEGEEETTISLGVVDSAGNVVYFRDEVKYESTGETEGGMGLVNGITKGSDPFLLIKPVFTKTGENSENVYTHIHTIKRKPHKVTIISTTCRVMISDP